MRPRRNVVRSLLLARLSISFSSHLAGSPLKEEGKSNNPMIDGLPFLKIGEKEREGRSEPSRRMAF